MASPAVIASVKSFDCEKSHGKWLWDMEESKSLKDLCFLFLLCFKYDLFSNNRENKIWKYFDSKNAWAYSGFMCKE